MFSRLILASLIIIFVLSWVIEANVSNINNQTEFPLEEFIQSAFTYPVNFTGDFMEIAKETFLCGSDCCDCEPDCFRKQSCCIDKLWNTSNPIPLSEYMKNFKKEVDKTLPLQCKFFEPFGSLPIFKQMTIAKPDSRLEYFLVNSCPPDSSYATECIKDESLPDIERLPVIDKRFYIFKNKYCAMCNNVESFVNLNLTVKCTTPVITGQPTVIITAPPNPPFTNPSVLPKETFTVPTLPPNPGFTVPPLPPLPGFTVPPLPPKPEVTVSTLPPNPEFTVPTLPPHPGVTDQPLPPQPEITSRPTLSQPEPEHTGPPLSPNPEFTIPPLPSHPTEPEVKAKDLMNEFQECLVQVNPNPQQAPHNRMDKLKCNARKVLKRRCQDPNSYCHLYKSSIAGYQNLHCHQCNGELFTESILQNQCVALPDEHIIWSIHLSFTRTSTRLTLDTQDENVGEQVHCSSGQLYNILKGTCEKFTCSAGYYAREKYCIKNNSSFPHSQDYQWYRDTNQVEYYLTHVCVSISVLGGVLLIVTHTLFKELRNRGGLLLIGLSSAILFTDILFFICEQNNKVVGILLHWGLLVINLWTIIIAVDLCATFLRKGFRTFRNTVSWMDYFYFSLVAYVTPLLIVILCVILDETNTIHFGYGENNVCWMSSYYPRIISYTIPSLLVNLSCIVCLLVLLMYLKKQNQERKSKLKSSYRVNLTRLALKLVSLLGVIELVGFIQIPNSTLTENEMKFNASFAFIYGVLRSLRNTFIFLFVLMDSKTLKLYRKFVSSMRTINTSEVSIPDTVLTNLNAASSVATETK
ncbi:uncharacterized protein [Clytia hemisphaerica]